MPGWMFGSPELLAPAGSREALEAAVGAGADAVYLAGQRFGARRYAGNFDDDELARAIRFAHLSGVRVFVAVNTLVLDREIPDAIDHLTRVYDLGADAILVQDLGIAALAREIMPDMPLHASTQMTVHNREGVEWAAGHGFSRVVLSRELPLPEIAEISRAPGCLDTGLEIFVHGALCYCYSGQCLLSSLIGGRSGNRGMCAQPCRKPYTLLEGGKDRYGRLTGMRPAGRTSRYPLSTRDLSAYRMLGALAGTRIAALKIEGRMRTPRYVATVVDVYRRAIDAVGRGDFSPSREDEIALTLAFSRGFTPGWLMGKRHAGILGADSPDNTGLPIGTVRSFSSRQGALEVQPAGDLVPEPGDGIVFIDPGTGASEGAVVSSPVRVRDGLIVLHAGSHPEGTEVWLTRQASLDSRAAAIASRDRPPWPIDLVFTVDRAVPVLHGTVTGPAEVPSEITVQAGFSMVAARGRALTGDDIRRQLVKTGGTRFFVKSLDLRYPGGLFAPVSRINALRREFLVRAESAILSTYTRGREPAEEMRMRGQDVVRRFPAPRLSTMAGEKESRPVTLSLYTDNPATVSAAVAAGCGSVYFEPYPHAGPRSCENPGYARADDLRRQLSEASSTCAAAGASFSWKWPRITRRKFLDSAFEVLESGPAFDAVLIESAAIAGAVIRKAPGLALIGGTGLNIMNSAASGALPPEFQRITLSPEIPGEDLLILLSSPGKNGAPLYEVIVQGNLEVMVAEECLLAGPGERDTPCTAGVTDHTLGLRDGSGRTFPIRIDPECRTHVYNAIETCLVDRLPHLFGQGLSGIAIDARGRGPAYASNMISIYREAIAVSLKQGPDAGNRLRALKVRAKGIAQGGITAGYLGSLREPG